MPSTWTDLDFEMQAAGENNNTWGADHLNNAISRINSAFGGYLSIAITGDYTLTTTRPTTSMVPADFSGRIALLKFTGALAANATITVPATAMSRSIWNATNKVLTITTGAGSTVTIDAGDKNVVWCDGSGVHQITFGSLGLKDYIIAASAGGGAVPTPIGNAGKYLYSDGANVLWRQPLAADIGDYETNIKGLALAFAVAL